MRPTPSASRPGWIVSPVYDLALFVGPAWLALALASVLPGVRESGTSSPLWAWVVCTLMVDVAHVWSTTYRTYLDPEERARRWRLYLLAPAGCLLVGMAVYRYEPLYFWRGLAYLAVWHFIKQQYGMVALYGKRGAWLGRFDARLDKLVIYAVTLYPMVYWHTHARSFHWFYPGDFVSLPLALEGVARVAWIAALVAFGLRQAVLWRQGRSLSAGRILIVLTTAVTWYTGIVALDSEFGFTLTNTLTHGLPYMALIWIYNNRRWSARREASAPAPSAAAPLLSLLTRPVMVPLFLAIPFLMAGLEETMWGNAVWQAQHPLIVPALLGLAERWHLTDLAFVIVPLLALPQSTHFVIDGFIWKMNGSNPGLEQYIFGQPVR